MPLHHRRALLSDDCDPWYNCPPPPSPPFFTLSPSPSPSPPITSPPPWTPPFNFLPFPGPDLAPSPSPVHDGGSGGGRRDEGGTYGYGPVGGAIADHRRRFITYTLSAAAALAFLSLILLGISIAVRRRQQRRRRQALLAQAPAAATNVGNDDPEGGGGGGVVHHVWYIRTVGLDEAAIDSIAVTPYRAGSGLLGAADCSVCLGEFNDGELVRLLPKCGHAFHVPCIDTWLRAHVNCPLCRSDVLDPAAAAAGVDTESNIPADPYVSVNAVAEQGAAASDPTELDHEDDEEEEGQEAPRVEEDQHEQQLSPPEPLPQLPRPLLRNVRRAASMNAAMVSAAADVAALDRLPDAAPEEEEQNGGVKHQSGATGHASTERLPRSFFSRHCRARSSVLPL